MKEIAELIINNGGTVILAALFIYVYLEDRKIHKEDKKEQSAILKEFSASNNNIAESLNLLKTSMDYTERELKEHDERAITEFSKIEKDLIILKERKKNDG